MDTSNNKTALITGGAIRIGRAIALKLAEKNVNIVIHYNKSHGEAQALRELIRRRGVKCFLVSKDFFVKDAARNLMEEVFKLTGRLDYLINNAAIFFKDTPVSVATEKLEEILKINAFVPIELIKLLAEFSDRKAAVVNVLDTRILRADNKSFSYTLSKKMLFEATKIMALEFAPKIRINAVAPGPIMKSNNKEIRELAGILPLGIRPLIKDLTEAVWFLLSAESVTGTTIFVDSGQHLRDVL